MRVGACGQVYMIDDHIVLKTCRVLEPLSSDVSARDRWFYASETLYHFNLLKDERTALRLLQQHSHLNIAEVVDTDQLERIYLRKYQRLSEIKIPALLSRIQ